jgi:hypothetical protein
MKRLPAFSLVEIAIGLFILGLLLTAVMKGSKLIDSAKLQTCVHQIIAIKRDFDMWFDEQNIAVPDVKKFPLSGEPPKLGGKFLVEGQDGKYSLALTNSAGGGFLSPSQVNEFQKYFPEIQPTGCDMQGSAKTCRVSVPLN